MALLPAWQTQGRSSTSEAPTVILDGIKIKVLLCKKEDQLGEMDKGLGKDICEKSNHIREAPMLVLKFRDMMENSRGYLLRDWIDKVSTSAIRELKGFVKGPLSDYQAVENALTLPWQCAGGGSSQQAQNS